MGERTIAEIIGWTSSPLVIPGEVTADGEDYHTTMWRHPTIAGIRPTYTVDDLLAWLNEHLFHTWLEVYGDPAAMPEAWDVYVNYTHVVSYGNEQDRYFNACAPTLLAAFERIVRSADAAPSPTNA